MLKRVLLFTFVCCLSLMAFGQSKHEMRMVWIATVANIDWPPKGIYDSNIQKDRMIAMLDSFANININAIIFQVRPTADALYQSHIEQWSKYLTGKQGKAPNPYYDPLAFIIREAHQRNIDVHIWINPYRLLKTENLEELSDDNLFFRKPDLFIKYGTQYFFNPAKEETITHLQSVIADLVSRYDIDGVHIDDYFYPYPIGGKQFPDDHDFKADNRGFSNKNDWRRDNVNRAIDAIYSTIKRIKPYVEFGVSPFGVWRNKNKDPRGSATKALSNYDDLYADILHWIYKEQVDYVIPQLYWEIGHRAADYTTLAHWWSRNCGSANLYIGMYASNLGNENAKQCWQEGNELCRQLSVNKQIDNIKGVGLYSAVALMENRLGITDSLRQHHFMKPALLPTNVKYLNQPTVAPPQYFRIHFNVEMQKIWLSWRSSSSDTKSYAIYCFENSENIDINRYKNIVATTRNTYLDITDFMKKNYTKKLKFVITAINRYNIESHKTSVIHYQL